MKGLILFSLFLIVFSYGCTSHKVELEVKPMHITIDVNVKIDRELDDFFGDIDEAAEKIDSTQNEGREPGKN